VKCIKSRIALIPELILSDPETLLTIFIKGINNPIPKPSNKDEIIIVKNKK
jgi:hypothetical protein